MFNNLPQIVFVYDRYKKSSMDKKATVEMRITLNGKQKYISTGIKIYPNQWKKGQIINCPDALQMNAILDKMLVDVRQVILDMKDDIDISLIPQLLKRKRMGRMTFIEYCNIRSEIRKYGKTKDSQERYNRFIRMFTSWGKIVDFADITDKNIISYDKYLASLGMKTYSKWNNYHRFLNSFIIDAVNDGLLQRNPYRWVNIEKDKSYGGINKYLNMEEINKLKSSEMPTESLERIRDLFIFQTYTCMSYSDISRFNKDNIKLIKGITVYSGFRKKTNKQFTIPLLSPAMEILQKYNYKLPLISNVKYNLYLKTVAQAAGIDKPISSHWARHTGATLLLNEGIDMKIISRICGHSSTKITEQIYAKLLDETVIDAIKNSHLHRQE